MFSGIIEAIGTVRSVRQDQGVIRIEIEKPLHFNDLSIGDSLAVDGICLTVEAHSGGLIQCAIGPETLKVTGWSLASLEKRCFNLERSLQLGERVHGHIVTGHVDVTGTVSAARREGGPWGEALYLTIEFPKEFAKYIWRKGSITINGVSLTVNQTSNTNDVGTFDVCLIPETLKRTNLSHLEVGAKVNLEMDSYARGLVHLHELSKNEKSPQLNDLLKIQKKKEEAPWC